MRRALAFLLTLFFEKDGVLRVVEVEVVVEFWNLTQSTTRECSLIQNLMTIK